jgi:hypothetical protein
VKNILLNIFFVLLIKSETHVVRACIHFPKMCDTPPSTCARTV